MTDEAQPAADAKEKTPQVTLKVLVERVQKETGAKLKDVKTIVEAALVAMGDAMKAGESLRLPPFGTARVRKGADEAAGAGMRISVRGPKPGSEEKQAQKKAERAAKPRPERAAKAKAATKQPRGKKAKGGVAAPAEAE